MSLKKIEKLYKEASKAKTIDEAIDKYKEALDLMFESKTFISNAELCFYLPRSLIREKRYDEAWGVLNRLIMPFSERYMNADPFDITETGQYVSDIYEMMVEICKERNQMEKATYPLLFKYLYPIEAYYRKYKETGSEVYKIGFDLLECFDIQIYGEDINYWINHTVPIIEEFVKKRKHNLVKNHKELLDRLVEEVEKLKEELKSPETEEDED